MAGRVLLTLDEVADYCHVPPGTIRWLRQEGRFVPAIPIGRRLRWDVADVDAWLDEHREIA